MRCHVRRSRESDIEVISQDMREADKREIWRSHKSTPEQALELGIKGEVCLTFCVEDQPVAMFGVSRYTAVSPVGIPWLLGTEGIRKAAKYFLGESRKYVEAMNRKYSILENYVDKDNKLSVRWLKWLGFNLKEEIDVNGHTFIRFERRQNNV